MRGRARGGRHQPGQPVRSTTLPPGSSLRLHWRRLIVGQRVRRQGIDGNLRTLPWAATQTVCRPLGFWAFSAGFVFKTTPTVSKTLESGGKSSGTFLKTVGVSENRWVSARGRATGSRWGGGHRPSGGPQRVQRPAGRVRALDYGASFLEVARARARSVRTVECPVQDRRGRGSAAAMGNRVSAFVTLPSAAARARSKAGHWRKVSREPVCVSRVGERVNHILPAESTEHM